MPRQTPIENRNRALIALTALTAIRVGAQISLKLKHFDLNRMLVRQIPQEVATKFSKRIDTFVRPFSEALAQICLGWGCYLKDVELFAGDDPLFPKPAMGHHVNNCFAVTDLSREHWAGTAPVRFIMMQAFDDAGIPLLTPHRFRHMLVNDRYERGLNVAEMKALSRNLGHESAMTTLISYGTIAAEQQGRLIRGIKSNHEDKPFT
ncbi:site-specific integrase [Pararhizobium sp. IMCC21322]|uniref:site-specific integrase n=1 Tax=Pararhizobium sp. IMCC21322 TaxID=3067903 RepID=UPI003531ABFA